MIGNLFEGILSTRERTLNNARQVQGLQVLFDFIGPDEERELLAHIDKENWQNDLKRRVQHYGWKYDYRARNIDASCYLGALPTWMSELVKRVTENNLINLVPDQAIVNEYVGDQGISPHIDCEPCFGDTIVSISLGGSCVMNIDKDLTSKNHLPLLLEPRSIVILKDICRYNWFHGIPARKTDDFYGLRIKRTRRVSITFRKAIVL